MHNAIRHGFQSLLILFFVSIRLFAVDETPSVGDPARFFLGRNMEGLPFLFGTSFAEGRVIVLSFFAPDCEACTKEIPALLGLVANEIPEVKLLFVGVDSATNRFESVKDFVQPFGVSIPAVFDDKARITEMYGVKAVPTTFVIDPQQRIAYRKSGWGEGDLEALKLVLDRILHRGGIK